MSLSKKRILRDEKDDLESLKLLQELLLRMNLKRKRAVLHQNGNERVSPSHLSLKDLHPLHSNLDFHTFTTTCCDARPNTTINKLTCSCKTPPNRGINWALLNQPIRKHMRYILSLSPPSYCLLKHSPKKLEYHHSPSPRSYF